MWSKVKITLNRKELQTLISPAELAPQDVSLLCRFMNIIIESRDIIIRIVYTDVMLKPRLTIALLKII